MISCLHRRWADETGSHVVEFSLIAPLVIGVMAFGMSVFLGLNRQAQLERVAEIAARAAAVPSAFDDMGQEYRTQDQIMTAVDATTTGVIDSLDYTDLEGNALDPAVISSGQTFYVVARATWANPFVRLVNLLGTGVVGEVDTLQARATGVRE